MSSVDLSKVKPIECINVNSDGVHDNNYKIKVYITNRNSSSEIYDNDKCESNVKHFKDTAPCAQLSPYKALFNFLYSVVSEQYDVDDNCTTLKHIQ